MKNSEKPCNDIFTRFSAVHIPIKELGRAHMWNWNWIRVFRPTTLTGNLRDQTMWTDVCPTVHALTTNHGCLNRQNSEEIKAYKYCKMTSYKHDLRLSQTLQRSHLSQQPLLMQASAHTQHISSQRYRPTMATIYQLFSTDTKLKLTIGTNKSINQRPVSAK